MISWLIIIIMQLEIMNLSITECNYDESDSWMPIPSKISMLSLLSIIKKDQV